MAEWGSRGVLKIVFSTFSQNLKCICVRVLSTHPRMKLSIFHVKVLCAAGSPLVAHQNSSSRFLLPAYAVRRSRSSYMLHIKRLRVA